MRSALRVPMLVLVAAVSHRAVSHAAPATQPSIRSADAGTIAALERAVAEQPDDIARRRRLADAYSAAGRHLDAVAALREATARAPKAPGGWFALGRAYNAIKEEALRTFDGPREEPAWRQLLAADAQALRGQLTEVFTLYRLSLGRLSSMVTIHEAIADIYERTHHADWAAKERATAARSTVDCAARRALCAFRAKQYDAALDAALAGDDAESRYWRARAANELALAAFDRLEALPDSLERRGVRASRARAEQRIPDAVAEYKAMLALEPGNFTNTRELAAAYYLMRDYEQAIATVTPLLRARPEDGRSLELLGFSLLQLRRIDEALPILQRAVAQNPADPGRRLALGRAYLQRGDVAEAVPLMEPQLSGDRDGSLHIQLARAYAKLGQRDKSDVLLARSQELQRAVDAQNAVVAQWRITPPP
jgi:predicted Zn-dependent protease